MRKIFFILLSISMCEAEPAAIKNTQNEGMSAGRIFMWCGLGIGGVTLAVVCAPMVLSAGTIVTIKASAAALAAKAAAAGAAAKGAVIVAAPIATKINLTVAGARIAKDLVYSSPKQKLEALLKEEVMALSKAKVDLQDCLIKQNMDVEKNALGLPVACEEVAMIYALSLDGEIAL